MTDRAHHDSELSPQMVTAYGSWAGIRRFLPTRCVPSFRVFWSCVSCEWLSTMPLRCHDRAYCTLSWVIQDVVSPSTRSLESDCRNAMSYCWSWHSKIPFQHGLNRSKDGPANDTRLYEVVLHINSFGHIASNPRLKPAK